jgi:EAL domain-containing protein (putative c-di-GMP-specific phosphodiesterase class I)
LTVESLGQQLRDALPTRRLLSISLCDREANVLWLSEGVLGPDEHSLAVEALELLSADVTLPGHELALEDGRLAVFVPVRAPTAELVGVAMILGDGKALGDGTLERLTAAPMRAIMLRLAVLMNPQRKPSAAGRASLPAPDLPDLLDVDSAAAAAPAVAVVPAAQDISPDEMNDILEFELSAEATPPPLRDIPIAYPAAPAGPAPPKASAAPPADMLDLEFVTDTRAAPARAAPAARPGARAAPTPAPAPGPAAAPSPSAAPARAAAQVSAPPPPARVATPRPAVTPAPAAAPMPAAPRPTLGASPVAGPSSAAPAAASDPSLLMEVLQFMKLRAGGQTRRFQLLARVSPAQRDPAAQDALVLQRLMGWLSAHRAAWNSQPTSFTVNLSIATLEDERFVQKIATALHSHGIAGETFGFEVAEPLCTQRRAQVERFITQCEKIGCWVAIDDFSFDSQVLPLLRSKAVRLVKIDAKLSTSALKDKLSQAMVVATVQAAKVLGIHCSAKKVDSQAALQWLTAIGCDFAQGAALAAAQSLDSLASSPDPTGPSPVLRPA